MNSAHPVSLKIRGGMLGLGPLEGLGFLIIEDRAAALPLSAVEKHPPLCKCTGQLHSVSICLIICDMIDIESKIAIIHLLGRKWWQNSPFKGNQESLPCSPVGPWAGGEGLGKQFPEKVTPVSSLEQFGEIEPRKGHIPERE